MNSDPSHEGDNVVPVKRVRYRVLEYHGYWYRGFPSTLLKGAKILEEGDDFRALSQKYQQGVHTAFLLGAAPPPRERTTVFFQYQRPDGSWEMFDTPFVMTAQEAEDIETYARRREEKLRFWKITAYWAFGIIAILAMILVF